jgi:membrane protein YqaA with SNARE-associated domain
MGIDWRGVAGVGSALGATVFWAIGLAVLQRLSEPVGPDAYAENNTYWVRDLRFMAVIVVVLGLLLASGGARAGVKPILALGVAWIAADVVLDRVGVAGAVTAVVLAVVGCVAVLTVALSLARRTQPGDVRGAGPGDVRRAGPGDVRRVRPGDVRGVRPGDDIRRVAGRDRVVLLVAAAVGAALAPLAAGIESPTDTESALTPSAVIVGALLVVTTVGAALSLAPAGSTGCRIGAGTLAALGGAGVVAVAPVAPPGQLVPMMLLATVLLGGVSLLASALPGRRPRWRRQVPVFLAVLVGYPVLTMFWLLLTVFGVPVGAWLTALAGSAEVNAADSDTLYALIGLATGLLLGGLLTLAARAAPLVDGGPATSGAPVAGGVSAAGNP